MPLNNAPTKKLYTSLTKTNMCQSSVIIVKVISKVIIVILSWLFLRYVYMFLINFGCQRSWLYI